MLRSLASGLIAALVAASAASAAPQKDKPGKMPLPPPPPGFVEPTQAQLDALLVDPKHLAWREDAKLGIAVHWGPVSLTGAPMSWGRLGERPGAGKPATNGVPAKEYDLLYRRFNPEKFDAAQWIDLFKRAGAGSFVFTTKHHDGFCMWDSALTDYDIMSTPFGRDVTAELAEAAHERDLKIIWYHSQPDWTHPDALREHHYDRYLPYLKGQLEELLTHYGAIDGVWFDHLATRHYHWDALNLVPWMRERQPGLLINGRIGHGLPDRFTGDYDVFEMRVGPYDAARGWQSIITLSKAWGWHGGDLTKPFDATLRLLLQVVGNGGELMLNVGPTPEGEVFADDAAVLERIGAWLDDHGDAVYETRKGVYMPGPWGASTQKGRDLFLLVMEQAARDALAFDLPALPVQPESVELMTPGTLHEALDADRWSFTLNRADGTMPAVVRLRFARPLDGMEPVETFPEAKRIPLAAITASSERGGKKFSAAGLLEQSSEGVFGEGIHIKSWWAPGHGDQDPWIEVELDHATPVGTLMLSESMRAYATRAFRVSWADGDGAWHEAFAGSTIGEMLFVQLNAPKTRRLKIEFLETIESPPNITAVTLFRP